VTGYTISGYRETSSRDVIIEVVTDGLQRLHVWMPRGRTDRDQIDATITHAIAALYAKPSPVR
jgi:hypothetical protein